MLSPHLYCSLHCTESVVSLYLHSDNRPARAGVSSLQRYKLPHEGPERNEGLGQNNRGQALHPERGLHHAG